MYQTTKCRNSCAPQSVGSVVAEAGFDVGVSFGADLDLGSALVPPLGVVLASTVVEGVPFAGGAGVGVGFGVGFGVSFGAGFGDGFGDGAGHGNPWHGGQ